MRSLHKLVLWVASAAFFIASAQAQNSGTVANHAVPVGKGAGVSGFTSAAPGATGIPLTSNGASSDPTFHPVTNAGIAPGAANSVKGSVDGATTSDLAIASCSAIYQFTQWVSGSGWQCGINPVLPSRAVAATLNLSAFTSVKTLGYASPGDGGGATFKNVTTTAFRDSFTTGLSITANGTGSCTNGSYLGNKPSGGSGTNLTVNVTVSGNVVSAVAIVDTGGNGYVVGNSLTISGITGCSGAVTVQVSSVSTPSGSFSDSASNHWQIVPDEGHFINVKQFGVKADWTGTDGTATDDRVSIQNAYNFASDISGPTVDAGGAAGARVIHPRGTSLICGNTPLLLPYGVAAEGQNIWSSTLKMCATWTSGVTFMNICDPTTHTSCFGSYLRNLTLFAVATQGSSANTSMVYSNSIQQIDVFDRVAIYAGQRECLRLETGYGGAALLGMQNVECVAGNTSINAGIVINYGTTLVTMRNVHVESSATLNSSGLRILGGFVDLIGFHTEGITTGIEVNIPTSTANGVARLHGLSGGVSCTNLVFRQTGSVANSVVMGQAVSNGCTNTYNNTGTGSGAIVQVDDVKF